MWNYRVVNKENQLSIYGVYYDENGKAIGIDETPNVPFGENLEELEERFNLMKEALNKSILDYQTLKEIK